MSLATRRFPSLAKFALSGALLGITFSVAGCHWLFWPDHEDEALGFCDDAYSDCLAIAVSEEDRAWCEEDVKYCYESCEAGWDGEPGDYGDDDDDGWGSSGAPDPGGNESGGNESGGNESGGNETGEEPEDPGVCIELFGNCIDGAETLEDVEACETLYDQCVNPGECPEPECGGCPADELDACLQDYAICADIADDPEKVALCAENFDVCTEPFAEECQVGENPRLEPCLEQHALCIACADNELQVEACQEVFDVCLLQ